MLTVNRAWGYSIPNIPFFYLVYRGWSHWRGVLPPFLPKHRPEALTGCKALNGSRHLEYLVKNNLLNPISFPGLEQLYAKRVSRTLENIEPEKPSASMVEDVEKSDDTLLLRMKDAKKLASILEAPELALEAERAIIQVEEQLKAQESSEGKEKDTKKGA